MINFNNPNEIKKDENITGIMFQQPLPKGCAELINEIPAEQDIEGLGIENMGKLFLGKKDAIIPCTSKAVIETLDFYNVDLTGKKVLVIDTDPQGNTTSGFGIEKNELENTIYELILGECSIRDCIISDIIKSYGLY